MNEFYARNLEEWHAWLVEHYQTCNEVWLLFYKAGSGKPSLDYEESVEEALCFGWVDSLIKARDAGSHLRKFTPRKSGSKWSEVNVRRAQKMVDQGRMTPAGQELFAEATLNPAPSGASRKEQMETWRVELLERLSAETKGRYLALAPSMQRQYAGYVLSAKGEATRAKRQAELEGVLLRGEKLGLK